MRHVYSLPDGMWEVRTFQSGKQCWHGRFADEADAAECAAVAVGCQVDELTKDACSAEVLLKRITASAPSLCCKKASGAPSGFPDMRGI